MKISTLTLLFVSLSFSIMTQAEFYDDPINANNKKCTEQTSKTVDAMKMQEILKQAIEAEKAKPTPAILNTYYDIYDEIENGSKGVLAECKLNKEEKNKLINIGIHAAQQKAAINFLLNKK